MNNDFPASRETFNYLFQTSISKLFKLGWHKSFSIHTLTVRVQVGVQFHTVIITADKWTECNVRHRDTLQFGQNAMQWVWSLLHWPKWAFFCKPRNRKLQHQAPNACGTHGRNFQHYFSIGSDSSGLPAAPELLSDGAWGWKECRCCVLKLSTYHVDWLSGVKELAGGTVYCRQRAIKPQGVMRSYRSWRLALQILVVDGER